MASPRRTDADRDRGIGCAYGAISNQYLSWRAAQTTTSARRAYRLGTASCLPSGPMKNKKGNLKMLNSRIGLAVAGALVIGSSLIATGPASAADGCGPGWWRGPWGHCRDTPYTGPLPRGGYQVEFRAADNGLPDSGAGRTAIAVTRRFTAVCQTETGSNEQRPSTNIENAKAASGRSFIPHATAICRPIERHECELAS